MAAPLVNAPTATFGCLARPPNHSGGVAAACRPSAGAATLPCTSISSPPPGCWASQRLTDSYVIQVTALPVDMVATLHGGKRKEVQNPV